MAESETLAVPSTSESTKDVDGIEHLEEINQENKHVEHVSTTSPNSSTISNTHLTQVAPNCPLPSYTANLSQNQCSNDEQQCQIKKGILETLAKSEALGETQILVTDPFTIESTKQNGGTDSSTESMDQEAVDIDHVLSSLHNSSANPNINQTELANDSTKQGIKNIVSLEENKHLDNVSTSLQSSSTLSNINIIPDSSSCSLPSSTESLSQIPITLNNSQAESEVLSKPTNVITNPLPNESVNQEGESNVNVAENNPENEHLDHLDNVSKSLQDSYKTSNINALPRRLNNRQSRQLQRSAWLAKRAELRALNKSHIIVESESTKPKTEGITDLENNKEETKHLDNVPIPLQNSSTSDIDLNQETLNCSLPNSTEKSNQALSKIHAIVDSSQSELPRQEEKEGITDLAKNKQENEHSEDVSTSIPNSSRIPIRNQAPSNFPLPNSIENQSQTQRPDNSQRRQMGKEAWLARQSELEALLAKSKNKIVPNPSIDETKQGKEGIAHIEGMIQTEHLDHVTSQNSFATEFAICNNINSAQAAPNGSLPENLGQNRRLTYKERRRIRSKQWLTRKVESLAKIQVTNLDSTSNQSVQQEGEIAAYLGKIKQDSDADLENASTTLQKEGGLRYRNLSWTTKDIKVENTEKTSDQPNDEKSDSTGKQNTEKTDNAKKNCNVTDQASNINSYQAVSNSSLPVSNNNINSAQAAPNSSLPENLSQNRRLSYKERRRIRSKQWLTRKVESLAKIQVTNLDPTSNQSVQQEGEIAAYLGKIKQESDADLENASTTIQKEGGLRYGNFSWTTKDIKVKNTEKTSDQPNVEKSDSAGKPNTETGYAKKNCNVKFDKFTMKSSTIDHFQLAPNISLHSNHHNSSQNMAQNNKSSGETKLKMIQTALLQKANKRYNLRSKAIKLDDSIAKKGLLRLNPAALIMKKQQPSVKPKKKMKIGDVRYGNLSWTKKLSDQPNVEKSGYSSGKKCNITDKPNTEKSERAEQRSNAEKNCNVGTSTNFKNSVMAESSGNSEKQPLLAKPNKKKFTLPYSLLGDIPFFLFSRRNTFPRGLGYGREHARPIKPPLLQLPPTPALVQPPSFNVPPPHLRAPPTRSPPLYVPPTSVLPPSVPTPLVPSPLVPAPSVPTPLVPPPSVSTPLVPSPLVPPPSVPTPLVPSPLVPPPSVPTPLVPSPLVPPPLVPTPLVSPPPLIAAELISHNNRIDQEEKCRRKFQVLILSSREKGMVFPEEQEPVKRYLVAEMLKTMVLGGPDGPELHFDEAVIIKPGWVSVMAANEISFAWLLNGWPHFTLNGTTLRPVRGLDTAKISFSLTTPAVDMTIMLSILLVQNRSLKVDTWMPLGATGIPGAWKVIFLVSSEVSDKLRSQAWSVYYEMGKLYATLLPLNESF